MRGDEKESPRSLSSLSSSRASRGAASSGTRPPGGPRAGCERLLACLVRAMACKGEVARRRRGGGCGGEGEKKEEKANVCDLFFFVVVLCVVCCVGSGARASLGQVVASGRERERGEPAKELCVSRIHYARRGPPAPNPGGNPVVARGRACPCQRRGARELPRWSVRRGWCGARGVAPRVRARCPVAGDGSRPSSPSLALQERKKHTPPYTFSSSSSFASPSSPTIALSAGSSRSSSASARSAASELPAPPPPAPPRSRSAATTLS